MESHSAKRRLPIQRIAITVPPEGWFHGIDRALCDIYRQGLVDLGLAVFDVPVDAFVPPDAARISSLTSELRAFQPDLALGLSHGSYALVCRLPVRRDGWRPNLFTEVLEIPTICFWDHAPMNLADQLLDTHTPDPATSQPGAREILRRVLTHPCLIHWSRDSGQTKIMQDLGFLLPTHVIHERTPALPGFVPQKDQPRGSQPSVGFVGHLYQEPWDHPHPILSDLAGQVLQEWLDNCEPPLWEVLGRRIALLPNDQRRQLALDPDQTYFWSFAHRLIVKRAQTCLRLKLLGSANVPVACYGNLRRDQPGVPANLVPAPGHIPFGPPLAATLARHAIIIDVLNPGFVCGYSHKPVLGFASGGFVLVNRKQDFVDAFGEAGEAVSYKDGDDLRAKVDRFLSNPGCSREVGDVIREKIRASFQLQDVLWRVLRAAMEVGEAGGAKPASKKPVSGSPPVKVVRNLLPEMRCKPHWEGAKVEHGKGCVLISSQGPVWSYAAEIVVPPLAGAMKQPHVRLSLIVKTGRVGILALLGDTETPSAEQAVSATSLPVTVTVDLPRERPATVIFRNTLETPFRALVLEASLCDHFG